MVVSYPPVDVVSLYLQVNRWTKNYSFMAANTMDDGTLAVGTLADDGTLAGDA